MSSYWHVVFFVLFRLLVLLSVDQVENHHDFWLAHTGRSLVEAIEAREDHVNEFVSGLSVLEPSLDTVCVHALHESFEFSAVEQAVAVCIGRRERILDLLHEGCQRRWLVPEFLLEGSANVPLLLGELGLPLLLVRDKRAQELHYSGLLVSTSLLHLLHVSFHFL